MYDSTFSSPCLRAAREKHRFAAGKKHRNRKKHVWQQEKNALQRKKAASAAGKNVSKKSRFAAGKIQSSKKKHLAAAKKALLQQKKCILEAAGKNRPRREKTRPRQEKNRPRQEKNPQQRKSSFATQKVAATEKIHFRNGKKQQPLKCTRIIVLFFSIVVWTDARKRVQMEKLWRIRFQSNHFRWNNSAVNF